MVKDIIPGPGGSSPHKFFNGNGIVYFMLERENSISQLWKSNGTAEGTVLVKTNVYIPFSPRVATIDTVTYFTAATLATSEELWRTDGTAGGTYMVKDINPGMATSDPAHLINVQGTLYFAATAPNTGRDVWKSDGTPAGTVLVKDIVTDPGDFAPFRLTNVDSMLYYAAKGGLWKSNGTDSGTFQVESSMPVTGSQGSFPGNISTANGTVFFTLQKSTDIELWKSNGTAEGTLLVKTIKGLNYTKTVESLTDVNGLLYFVIRYYENEKYVNEVWKSDGSEAGTSLVKSFSNMSSSAVQNLTSMNGTLYFTFWMASATTLSQLWKSNGTLSGTTLVKEFHIALYSVAISELTVVNNTLFFATDDGVTGIELWKSNGTPAGTILVKDIASGSANSYPNTLTIFNDVLYFHTISGLWKSDGTEAGTMQVSNVEGSNLRPDMITGNGVLYFKAYSNANGNELWKSDGTEAGTAVLKNFGFFMTAHDLTFVNGHLYFTTEEDDFSGVLYYKLWKSNGTAEETLVLKEIPASRLIAAGNTLLFANQDKLWRSNGTAESTQQVADLSIRFLPFSKPVNNTFYFSGDDGKTGYELWKYETEACTEVINPKINLQGNAVCSGENGIISIQNSQPGIFYQAYIRDSPVGTQVQGGGNITLTIPALSLSVGNNTFTVKASGCVLTELAYQPTIYVLTDCGQPCSASGSILQEVWLNAAGSAVSDIPLNFRPSSTKQLTSFEAPSNAGTNYGQRIRGYLCVPTSGEYRFYISGDDRCTLYLSGNDDPANKVNIAAVPYYTTPKQWNKYADQKSVAIALVAGKKYYIEALHKEALYADHLAVGWQTSSTDSITVIPGSVLSPYVPQGEGKITREVWTNIEGSDVSAIPMETAPSDTDELISFETASSAGNNYGQRIRGYVHPQVSGEYKFYIAGDDQCELYLSSDDNAGNKTKIGTVPYYTAIKQWYKYDAQRSAPIYLVAGKKYYIEALHKEGQYADHLAVAWTLPGQAPITVISGNYLSPYLSSTASIARKGVEEHRYPGKGSIYPNPFEDKLTVSALQQGIAYICVTDNVGRVVYQKNSIVETELHLAHLKAGVYVLKVVSEQGETTLHKIIKR